MGATELSWAFMAVVWTLVIVRTVQSLPERKCPYCQEKIDKKATVCKHCRSDVT